MFPPHEFVAAARSKSWETETSETGAGGACECGGLVKDDSFRKIKAHATVLTALKQVTGTRKVFDSLVFLNVLCCTPTAEPLP